MSFKPTDSHFQVDPYQTYSEMRARDPLCFFAPWNAWFVFSYDGCIEGLRHPQLRRENPLFPGRIALTADNSIRMSKEHELLFRCLENMLLLRDAPVHTELKKAVQRFFVPSAQEHLSNSLAAEAFRVLKLLPLQHELDFISQVAVPVATKLLGELMGVPPGEASRLRALSLDFAPIFELDITDELVDRATNATKDLREFLRTLLRQNIVERDRASLMSSLLLDLDEGSLSEEEVLAMLLLLLVAGYETTVNALGNVTWVLAQQARWPISSPTSQAVEEALRMESPVQAVARFAGEDLVLESEGYKAPVSKGQQVLFMLGSANRDEKVFSSPEIFLPDRTNWKAHLAYGYGAHYCLGAAMSRTVLYSFFDAVARLYRVELTDNLTRMRPGFLFRGYAELAISLSPL